jgi:hypothetical protein
MKSVEHDPTPKLETPRGHAGYRLLAFAREPSFPGAPSQVAILISELLIGERVLAASFSRTHRKRQVGLAERSSRVKDSLRRANIGLIMKNSRGSIRASLKKTCFRTDTSVASSASRNSRPKATTLPSWTLRNAPINVSNVVLPEPEGPVRITISPGRTSREISKRTWRLTNLRQHWIKNRDAR